MSLKRFMVYAALLALSVVAAVGQTDPAKEKGRQAASGGQGDVGRFRATLTGFTVNQQTRDNVLETDGRGDEVYLLAEVAQYDAYLQKPNTLPFAGFFLGSNDSLRGRGNLTVRRSLASVLMGDVNNQSNPPRIQAGSAGSQGGLRSGDRYPTNEPWLVRDRIFPDRPPMLLWEGELRRGRDLVAIAATIWEWDGGNQQLRAQFTEDINRYFLPASVNPYEGFVWRGLTGLDLFGAGDRPIGMLERNPWFPRGLELNFETAQSAAATSPSHTGTGVIELRYTAATEDYSLYFKIERLR